MPCDGRSSRHAILIKVSHGWLCMSAVDRKWGHYDGCIAFDACTPVTSLCS
jgi:hypothetical protein